MALSDSFSVLAATIRYIYVDATQVQYDAWLS
jgi:hypothetical protein